MGDIVDELKFHADGCRGQTVSERASQHLLARAALEIAALRAAAHALQRTPCGDSDRPEAIKAVTPAVVARDIERLGWEKHHDGPLGSHWRHAGFSAIALPSSTDDGGYCVRIASAATQVGLQQGTSAVEVLARWFRESAL